MSNIVNNYLKIIRKVFPVNAKSSVVGLDIGPSSCKAVELVCRNGGYELLRWMVEPVVGTDDKALSAALGKILSAFGLQAKARPLITSVSGKGTLIRYVDMPKMSQMDLRRAFAIESDKYFPFPRDTVYTDCHILSTFDGNRKMSVLVAAVKKDLVESRMKVLKEAGLDSSTVTLNPVAVANAFATFPPDGFLGGAEAQSFKACAVVDIGETGTNLMIIFAGSPRFNRDIFIGAQEIYKRAANLLGVPQDEVRGLLAYGKPVNETLQKGVSAVMADLISEIRLSFDYFITEKNLAVTQIFLTGDGACIAGVEPAFRQGIDIPVAVWDPFEKMAAASPAVKEGLKPHGSSLIGALGMALNEYDQG
ncbi:MAG: type IV pilus assembly protein PilM [Candidatus Omnitrophica bacterium]|nr:type IV pilus assembly protein PilM [Candidatus Omnitrophota bacterium]